MKAREFYFYDPAYYSLYDLAELAMEVEDDSEVAAFGQVFVEAGQTFKSVLRERGMNID